MRYCHIRIRMATVKKQTNNKTQKTTVGEDVDKLEPPCMFGSINGAAVWKTIWWFLKYLKIALTIPSSNPISEYAPTRIEGRVLKRYLCTHVHSSIPHSSQKVSNLSALLASEWMSQMWDVYTMEYYSALRRRKTLQHATT